MRDRVTERIRNIMEQPGMGTVRMGRIFSLQVKKTCSPRGSEKQKFGQELDRVGVFEKVLVLSPPGIWFCPCLGRITMFGQLDSHLHLEELRLPSVDTTGFCLACFCAGCLIINSVSVCWDPMGIHWIMTHLVLKSILFCLFECSTDN